MPDYANFPEQLLNSIFDGIIKSAEDQQRKESEQRGSQQKIDWTTYNFPGGVGRC